MTNPNQTVSQGPVSGAFAVNPFLGARNGRVSSEWFSRPDDQRFLNLDDLYAATRKRSDTAHVRTVRSGAIQVVADRDDAESLKLICPGRPDQITPTHWSFGQLCGLVGAPSGYVQRAPVEVKVLSDKSLKAQTRYIGVTWLDQELMGTEGNSVATNGFGGEVRAALRARQQWLVEEGLITEPDAKAPASLLTTLHRREWQRATQTLEDATGKTWREVRAGDVVEGHLRERLKLGAGDFAVVERAKDFALVPWRPVLEKHIGKTVSGVLRERGINWTIGRGQDLDVD